jgi:DNA invertase Pin-like site-specific DNA recombinase
MQAEVNYNSCESQEEKVISFINSQDTMKHYKTYSDPGFSGGNTERPALQELLKDVQRNKIDLILSYKIDRLTRSPKDFYNLIELFEKYNVDFISVTERFDTSTPSGRLLRNIMLMFADYERSLARERTRDKMLQRAQKGIWNGGTVPYGYSNVNKKLVVNKQEAKIVKLIYEQYIDTGSLSKVHKLLNRLEIPYKKNKPFQIDTIAYLLRNPIYTGKIKYAGKLYDGIHEPIISEKLFNKAQKHHKTFVRKSTTTKKLPFAGIITCKECNTAMTPTYTNKYKGNKLRRYFYYQCVNTAKHGWDSCGTKQVNADRLELYIIDKLSKINSDYKLLEYLVYKTNHEIKTGVHPRVELLHTGISFDPKIAKFFLDLLLNNLKNKKGNERCKHIKKYISGIIYSPEEIEIDLFYSPEYYYNSLSSIDDKPQSCGGEAARNQNRNVNNPNEYSFLAGGRREPEKGNSSFTDFLNSSKREWWRDSESN